MNSALRRYIPEFDYVLIDLSLLTNEQIDTFQSSFLRISAMLLKHRHNKKRQEDFFRSYVSTLFVSLPEEDQRRFIESVLLYILATTDLTGSDVIAIFTSVSQESNQVVMNAIEKLNAENTIKHIKGLLNIGMDAKTIALAFEMPVEEVEAIIEQIRSEESK